MESAILERACPDCGTTIRHDRAFVPWCDACNWNVDAELRSKRQVSRLDAFRKRLGRRFGDSLYRQLLRRQATKPPIGLSRVAALAICVLVLAASAGILILGIRIIATSTGFIATIFGIIFVVIAVLGRPRFAPLPERRIERADAPELYGLLDEISDRLRAPRIHTVGVDHEWNASTYRAGLRGRVVVNLGLPLWAALEPAERVAILGHELAHQVNGDTTRGLVASAALETLAWWTYVIEPDGLTGDDPGVTGLLAIPANLVLMGVARGIELVSRLIILLLYRDSQRAEFYADRLAVSVAGSANAVAGLRAAAHGTAYLSTVGALAIANRPPENLYEELRARIARTPASEIERRRRAEEQAGTAIEATHPPDYQRVGVIEAAPPVQPTVILTAERAARIDAELAAHRIPVARRAVEEYVDDLS